MRLFLRYQISGSMFFFWLIVFYYGCNADNLTGLINNISFHDKDYILGAVAVAIALSMPIGTLIHQLSIVIKNWVIFLFFQCLKYFICFICSKCFKCFKWHICLKWHKFLRYSKYPFSDFPDKELISKLNINGIGTAKQAEYCLDRISNLNSFYYVRFDNGFLAPCLAYLVIRCGMGYVINGTWLYLASAIGLITLIYIPRINCEIKEYRKILNGL